MSKVTPITKPKLKYAETPDIFVVVRTEGSRNYTLPLTPELEAQLLEKLIIRSQPWGSAS